MAGLTSVVATALKALLFTPTEHQTTAGGTVTTRISVVASQTGGGSTVSATNTASSVVATAVNDPPTLTGGTISHTTDETATLQPFATVTLADVDTSTIDIVTIKLSSGDSNGTIASGATWVSPGTYTLAGLTSVVATALQALVFTPTAHQVTPGATVTTGVTVVVSQTGGGNTFSATNSTSSVIATAVNDPPTVTGGTVSATNDETTTLKPFATVTVADVDLSTTESVTITLSAGDNDGTLTGATWISAGSYKLSGLPATLTAALVSMIFIPTAHQVAAGGTVTTSLTISASQTANGVTAKAANTTTEIVATAVNDPPTISGAIANQNSTDLASLVPMSSVTIADVDLSTTENVAITLSAGDANGTLVGASWVSAGHYQLSGLPATLTAALDAIIFIPTAHQVAPGNTVTTSLTLTASQTAGGSTTSATNGTTTVVVTAVNDAPTISGAVADQSTTDTATLSPTSRIRPRKI